MNRRKSDGARNLTKNHLVTIPTVNIEWRDNDSIKGLSNRFQVGIIDVFDTPAIDTACCPHKAFARAAELQAKALLRFVRPTCTYVNVSLVRSHVSQRTAKSYLTYKSETEMLYWLLAEIMSNSACMLASVPCGDHHRSTGMQNVMLLEVTSHSHY